MRRSLVVPGLLGALPANAPGTHALARLAAFGRAEALAHDLDRAVATLAGLPADAAIAPLAALGAGLDPGTSYVLRADPVSLVAGRDDVLLTGRVDDLAADEAEALVATLTAQFAGDGLAFHAPRPDAWFVSATAGVPVDTTPLDRVTGAIQPFLPQGPHAKTWRRWLSEMQMILHAHPVNAMRESAGRAPLTGIWISQGGTLARDVTPAPGDVRATARPAGDVARGLALLAGKAAMHPPESFGELAGDDALVVLDPVTDGEGAARLARAWLDPAVAALTRGDLDELIVLGSGGGHTQRWSARTPSLFARLRARLRGTGAPR